MSQLNTSIDEKIRKSATQTAEKRMPDKWDRACLTYVNVFNAYFLEAMQIEYNLLLSSAHAHGFIQGAMKSLTVTQSLRAFYEDI